MDELKFSSMIDEQQYCVKRECLHCGEEFVARASNHKFCSTKCCHRKMAQQYRKRKMKADRAWARWARI